MSSELWHYYFTTTYQLIKSFCKTLFLLAILLTGTLPYWSCDCGKRNCLNLSFFLWWNYLKYNPMKILNYLCSESSLNHSVVSLTPNLQNFIVSLCDNLEMIVAIILFISTSLQQSPRTTDCCRWSKMKCPHDFAYATLVLMLHNTKLGLWWGILHNVQGLP